MIGPDFPSTNEDIPLYTTDAVGLRVLKINHARNPGPVF